MADTTSGRVIIRISALPDSALRRALAGTVDTMRRASKEGAAAQTKAASEGAKAQAKSAAEAAKAVAQSAKEAAREQARQTRQAAREAEQAAKAEMRAAREVEREKRRAGEREVRDAERAADAEVRAADKAAQAKVRLAERAARAEQREAQATARAQIREAERALKEQSKLAQRSGEERRRLMLATGAGAYGGIKGAVELVGRGQGLAGVGSLEERLQNAGDFRSQLIRTAGEAKVSPEERAKVEANLIEVSKETNVSLLDLVTALATAQGRFDKFREFAGTIGDLARVAQATGENLDDLVGAVGTASQVFQLDEAGQREFISTLIATAERGSINVGDFARNLAGTAGSFQIGTGHSGIQGAREFLATAQVLGTSQVGASETATMMERFVGSISLPQTQGLLKEIGVNVLDSSGSMRNIGDIGSDLLANKHFQQAGIRQAIFPEVRAMRGAEFLMAELRRDPEAFRNLQNVDAGIGKSSVDSRFAELSNQSLFRLQNVGITAQADTVRDADRIVQSITPAVTELTKLQTQFPLLTESVSSLEQAVRWGVGTFIADRFIRGGGGAAGGVALGTSAGEALARVAAPRLSEAFSSASMLGKLGMAGQVLGVGLTAYLATKEIAGLFGLDDKKLGELGVKLHDAIFGAPSAPTTFTTGSLVRDSQQTTGAIEARHEREQSEAALDKFLGGTASSGPGNPNALRSPMIPPDATLTVKIVGPGEVTTIDSKGFGTIETVGGTGRRDVFPP